MMKILDLALGAIIYVVGLFTIAVFIAGGLSFLMLIVMVLL